MVELKTCAHSPAATQERVAVQVEQLAQQRPKYQEAYERGNKPLRYQNFDTVCSEPLAYFDCCTSRILTIPCDKYLLQACDYLVEGLPDSEGVQTAMEVEDQAILTPMWNYPCGSRSHEATTLMSAMSVEK